MFPVLSGESVSPGGENTDGWGLTWVKGDRDYALVSVPLRDLACDHDVPLDAESRVSFGPRVDTWHGDDVHACSGSKAPAPTSSSALGRP